MDLSKKLLQSSFSAYLILSFCVLLIVLLRLRLLDFPLERDEGEYAYMGQLILKSVPPYKLAYSMKFPGTAYMYALMMWFFGETTNGIHTGLLICNAANMILIFLITRKLVETNTAQMASLLYGWMGVSATVMGFAGHATHFVVLMALMGTWIVYIAIQRGNYFLYALAGIFYSLSYLMKQHGIFFIAMGQVLIIFCNNRNNLRTTIKASLFFLVGVGFPVLILFITMYLMNVLENFWFWTVTYAISYENQIGVANAFTSLLFGIWYVTRSFFIVWLFSLVGFFFLLSVKKQPLYSKDRLFIIIFAVFSFLTVVPGFYFRPHYFITLLPAISVLAAIGARCFFLKVKKERTGMYLSWLSVSFAILVGIFIERNYFLLERSMDVLNYSIYTSINGFPEMEQVAEFVEANTDAQDKVFVFGSEPQIYFYADRISATGYLYMYPFVENHKQSLHMQNEMISEVESANPEVLVYVHTVGSWANKIQTLPNLRSWFETFSSSGYEEVGVVDLISEDKRVVKWDSDIRDYTPTSSNFIKVFKRKIPSLNK